MAVERGQVQAKEFTKNGKPKVKIGGNWYFAGRCDVSSLNPGQSIEFDWSEFGEERNGRRPKGLNNWALLPAGAPVPQATGHTDEPMSEPKRMFVSNVASAALHGTGASSEDIQRVIRAVSEAYDGLAARRQHHVQTPRQSAPAPSNGHLPTDYERDMPPSFYEDGPAPEEPPRGTRTW